MTNQKILKKFRRTKRGVVRTIDFLVSFTLFIILVTQFYLIVINMNLNLAFTSTSEENPAEEIVSKLLGKRGSPNWGSSPGIPSQLGLASEFQTSNTFYNIDLAKLSRLNKELDELPISSTYNYIDPDTLIDQLFGIDSKIELRLSTRPLINVQTSATIGAGSSTIDVTALSWGNRTLSNVGIEVYHVDLADGSSPIAAQSSNTNTNGFASITTTGLGTNNYIAVVLAHSGYSWGISWEEINLGGVTILPQNISSYMMPNQDLTSNSMYQYTNNTRGGGLTVYTNTAFFNPANTSLVLDNNPTSSPNDVIEQNVTKIGTNGPVIQVSSLVDAGIYYYRVLTLPLVFDYTNYLSFSSSTFESNQYPVYETNGFSSANLDEIYLYSTAVNTNKGTLLLTVEAVID